jgi:hypothetical protein
VSSSGRKSHVPMKNSWAIHKPRLNNTRIIVKIAELLFFMIIKIVVWIYKKQLIEEMGIDLSDDKKGDGEN